MLCSTQNTHRAQQFLSTFQFEFFVFIRHCEDYNWIQNQSQKFGTEFRILTKKNQSQRLKFVFLMDKKINLFFISLGINLNNILFIIYSIQNYVGGGVNKYFSRNRKKNV